MNKSYLFIVFLLAVTALGELMFSIDARITFLIYFMMIIFFLFSFSKAGPLNREGILASMFLIIPMIRITQMFLHVGEILNNAILYICFLYLAIICIFRFKIKPGFTNRRGYFIIIAMLAGGALGVGFGNIALQHVNENLIYVIPLMIFAEELYFRGILQRFIDDKYGRLLGVAVISLLYFILTLNQGIYTALIFFVFYIVGSVFYVETKNLFVTMGYSLMFHLFFLFHQW